MTAPVNVKNLLGFCRANGYRFYPAAIYCVTRTLGRIENFRMFRNADGELCVWDRVVPNYTIFHADDCTFSDCWTDFSDDFGTFYRAVTADMQTFGGNHGIKRSRVSRRTSTAFPARRGSRSPAAAAA